MDNMCMHICICYMAVLKEIILSDKVVCTISYVYDCTLVTTT